MRERELRREVLDDATAEANRRICKTDPCEVLVRCRATSEWFTAPSCVRDGDLVRALIHEHVLSRDHPKRRQAITGDELELSGWPSAHVRWLGAVEGEEGVVSIRRSRELSLSKWDRGLHGNSRNPSPSVLQVDDGLTLGGRLTGARPDVIQLVVERGLTRRKARAGAQARSGVASRGRTSP